MCWSTFQRSFSMKVCIVETHMWWAWVLHTHTHAMCHMALNAGSHSCYRFKYWRVRPLCPHYYYHCVCCRASPSNPWPTFSPSLLPLRKIKACAVSWTVMWVFFVCVCGTFCVCVVFVFVGVWHIVRVCVIFCLCVYVGPIVFVRVGVDVCYIHSCMCYFLCFGG